MFRYPQESTSRTPPTSFQLSTLRDCCSLTQQLLLEPSFSRDPSRNLKSRSKLMQLQLRILWLIQHCFPESILPSEQSLASVLQEQLRERVTESASQ